MALGRVANASNNTSKWNGGFRIDWTVLMSVSDEEARR